MQREISDPAAELRSQDIQVRSRPIAEDRTLQPALQGKFGDLQSARERRRAPRLGEAASVLQEARPVLETPRTQDWVRGGGCRAGADDGCVRSGLTRG